MDCSQQHTRVFSGEFFPPHDDEGAQRLRHTRERLATLPLSFFSVTYGAGGSTRNRTLEAVLDIHLNSAIDAAPHLTCIASTKENVRAILEHYRTHGIHRIIALRGDLPSGMLIAGELRHANDLVSFIRAETADHFTIEVAAYPECHPQAVSAQQDLDHFQRKVEAGADGAITQYFYNTDAYFRFVDHCTERGIDIPIVPGIMPITNYKQLARFSQMCGAEIPRWICKRLEGFGDDGESIYHFGIEVVTGMCQRLLEQGAPGLHFYTMNRAGPTLDIWNNLGLPLVLSP